MLRPIQRDRYRHTLTGFLTTSLISILRALCEGWLFFGGWPSFADTTTIEAAPALLLLQSWARCCWHWEVSPRP
jgi:hypothetical protein